MFIASVVDTSCRANRNPRFTKYSDNERITVVELRNPDTGAGSYALRHKDPTSESDETFRLSVKTSAGEFRIPEHGGTVTLAGHFAKILVANFALGTGGAVLTYSTAEALTYGIFDGGQFEVQLDNSVRVLVLDRDAAHSFWVPAVTNDPLVPEDKVERLPSYTPNPPTWIPATHTTTPNPDENATLPYLYADDYGIHAGFILWRAVFPSPATALHLVTQGGILHAHSIYLNSHPLSSFFGSLTAASGTSTIPLPQSLLHNGTENVILVLQDTSAHEQGSAALRPRGILNATLLGSDAGFSSWHLAGTAGRSAGFDDSTWEEGSPSDGLTGAGVMFHRSIVPLDTPDGHDVSLSIRLGLQTDSDNYTDFRACMYVNEYLYGKYLPKFAPLRNTFPVQGKRGQGR
ncbi:putative beta-galactosidase b [Colletotrichum musicola]|uniref:Putative beta-galactosidase b n=1 Tax=Colletotrichum musicola TaxID=2175873 RepID=A0A8H6J4X4_9PEZI|nr:putative beta-galactosidase b [Colletotrichum musicola]